jgi:hypothetical protein
MEVLSSIFLSSPRNLSPCAGAGKEFTSTNSVHAAFPANRRIAFMAMNIIKLEKLIHFFDN